MTTKLIERDIITIDEELCDGCGVCVPSCHEGAIRIIDGKAKLIDDSFCDGLGDCLAECPQDAITIVKKEVAPYDQEAVDRHLKELATQTESEPETLACGCPGSMERTITHEGEETIGPATKLKSELKQWPVKIELVNPGAPYFQEADLAVIADCSPIAFANTHNEIMKGKAVAIGCPKFGDLELYLNKIAAIIDQGNVRSISVYRMEVPCCSGLVHACLTAAQNAKRKVPVEEVVVGIEGEILTRRWL
jgi:Pyruvate/2-oxoacid:ferredoxin oxidoreductase delta subunit